MQGLPLYYSHRSRRLCRVRDYTEFEHMGWWFRESYIFCSLAYALRISILDHLNHLEDGAVAHCAKCGRPSPL